MLHRVTDGQGELDTGQRTGGLRLAMGKGGWEQNAACRARAFASHSRDLQRRKGRGLPWAERSRAGDGTRRPEEQLRPGDARRPPSNTNKCCMSRRLTSTTRTERTKTRTRKKRTKRRIRPTTWTLAAATVRV
jgi:hypothetical protein